MQLYSWQQFIVTTGSAANLTQLYQEPNSLKRIYCGFPACECLIYFQELVQPFVDLYISKCCHKQTSLRKLQNFMGAEFVIDWSLYSTRQSTQLNHPQCRISAAERAFCFRASNQNSLSNETRNSASFEAGFQSLSVKLGFWIPILSRILDALSSRFQSPGFQIPKQNFPGFRNHSFIHSFIHSLFGKAG